MGGSPVRFESCPASPAPARWIVPSLFKILCNISKGNRHPCLSNWIPSTVCYISKLPLLQYLRLWESFQAWNRRRYTNSVWNTDPDTAYKWQRIECFESFYYCGSSRKLQTFFSRRREFLFSFCVNGRFLHNSFWNPRYSCSLYSCLGRDSGWKIELCISDSHHLSEKATLQQDAENGI